MREPLLGPCLDKDLERFFVSWPAFLERHVQRPVKPGVAAADAALETAASQDVRCCDLARQLQRIVKGQRVQQGPQSNALCPLCNRWKK